MMMHVNAARPGPGRLTEGFSAWKNQAGPERSRPSEKIPARWKAIHRTRFYSPMRVLEKLGTLCVVPQFEFGDKGSDPRWQRGQRLQSRYCRERGLTPCPQIQTEALPHFDNGVPTSLDSRQFSN